MLVYLFPKIFGLDCLMLFPNFYLFLLFLSSNKFLNSVFKLLNKKMSFHFEISHYLRFLFKPFYLPSKQASLRSSKSKL